MVTVNGRNDQKALIIFWK